jgi:hypothetical protein
VFGYCNPTIFFVPGNGGDVYFGEVQELEDGSCLRHGFGHQIFIAKAAETGDASECSEQRLTFLTLVPEKIRGHPCKPHGLSSFSR